MAAKGPRQGSAEKVSSIPHTRLNDEKQMEEIYEIKGLLGEGSFGVVREVVHLDTNQRWACKAINKEKAGGSKLKLLEREVAILKRVQHDHIICLKEVFETSNKMYLVMELCEGGELSKYLQKHGPMEESVVKQIMARLADAVSYLHKNDMVHRDLKLENILLSNDPHNMDDKFYIKVTDFGLSVVKGGVGHENMMMDFCGTPLYMAPEILDNKAYGQLCDVWAMGIIMYSLVCANAPFQNCVDEELYNMIRNADIQKRISEDLQWKKYSKEAKDLIQSMLDKDPAHRLTASEVLHHSWITGKDSKEGPKNVLEMMKEWGSLMNSEESSAVNGRKSVSAIDISPRERTHDCIETSRSTGNDKKSKVIAANRTTPTPKAKKLTRNTTDPNLLQTAKDFQKSGAKSTTPSHVTSSRSPTDRSSLTNLTARSGSRGQLYHGTKPLATHTTVSGPSSSNQSSSYRTSSSQPSSDQNHKPKKKISR